jgi:4,5-DOPA dioxygenase extradiol
MPALPPLFISHGAPSLVIEDHPARDFLVALGRTLQPTAVVVASAHWTTGEPTVSDAAQPATIHDFGGFPAELFRLRHPAPGAPELARRIAGLLAAAGLPCRAEDRGLDHGAWVPLKLMDPEARWPVVSLAVQPGRDAAHHLALGRALAPLAREGVLVLGSGSATHDLRSVAWAVREAPAWVRSFDDWLDATLAAGDQDALAAWENAPDARRNHPSTEHFLPLLVAAGAAGPGWRGRALHRSIAHGVLSMGVYAFARQASG